MPPMACRCAGEVEAVVCVPLVCSGACVRAALGCEKGWWCWRRALVEAARSAALTQIRVWRTCDSEFRVFWRTRVCERRQRRRRRGFGAEEEVR